MKALTKSKIAKLLKELKDADVNAVLMLSSQDTDVGETVAAQENDLYAVIDGKNGLYSNTADFVETGNTISKVLNVSDDTRYIAQYANNSMKTDFLFTILKTRQQ